MSRAAALTVTLLKELNKRATGKEAILLSTNLLESALNRPAFMAHYVPTSTEAQRAASLAFGLIKNHPFQDGNKRTAELAVNEYLTARGLKKLPSGNGLAKTIQEAHLNVAKGTMDDKKLAEIYGQVLGTK